MRVKKRLRCFGWFTLVAFLCSLLFSGCGEKQSKAIAYNYAYDDKGRVAAVALPGGKIKYAYDKEGMLAGARAPGFKVRFRYDDRNNMVLMKDGAGETEIRYDHLNRPAEVIYRHSPEKRIRYEYDPWSRITGMKVLNDNNQVEYQVSYEYDLLGNLTAVDDGAGKIRYAYFPEEGKVVRSLPNGIKSVFTFLPGGQLASLAHLDKNGELVVLYKYSCDSAGRVVEVREVTPRSGRAGFLPAGDLEAKLIKYEWDQRGYLAGLHYTPGGRVIRYHYDVM